MPHDLLCRMEHAAAAARAASAAIASVGDPAALAADAVMDKGAAGPATVADLAGQVAAIRALRSFEGPRCRIMAEESLEEVDRLGGDSLIGRVVRALGDAGLALSRDEVRDTLASGTDAGGAGGECWAIDPLDGTKGYLRGGQFAIAVGLMQDGAPAAGAVAAPRLAAHGTDVGMGVVFLAAAGQGAWQAPLAAAGAARAPIRARAWSRGDAIRLGGSVERAHSASDLLEAAAAALGPVTPVRVDSQAKYALVARGDADAYVRRSPSPGYREFAWDHVAGALVAREAGCTVTDVNGRPMDFAGGRRLAASEGVLCAAPGLHAALLAALGG
jgi:HAL2 family 3'(2'),5'-bisphosphate nucleotidase